MQLSSLGSPNRHAKAAGLYATAPILGCLVVVTFVSLHVFVHQRSNNFADLRAGARDMIHPSHTGRQLDRCLLPRQEPATHVPGTKTFTLRRDVCTCLQQGNRPQRQ